MSDMIDLSQLPPEVQALVQAAGGTMGNRSPVPKPLKDLRPPTTAKGRLHRPHFEWSADPDPNPPELGFQPVLFWDASGVEHAVTTEEALATVTPSWSRTPPFAAPMSAVDQIQKELLMLSPEDRAFLIDEQRKQRIARIQSRMSALPDAALAQLQAASAHEVSEPKGKEKTQKTA